MKKQLLTVLLLGLSALCAAQADKQETAYRRSSLYTIMIPDNSLTGETLTAVKTAFLENAFPDKYNDHNLSERILEPSKNKDIEVSEKEIYAYLESTGRSRSWYKSDGNESKDDIEKSKDDIEKSLPSRDPNERITKQPESFKDIFKDYAKSFKDDFKSIKDDFAQMRKDNREFAQDMERSSSHYRDAEYILWLTKYFTKNHVAGRMVAKWFGGADTVTAKPIDLALIEDRGLNTLSQDEMNKAMQIVGGKERLLAAAEYDLMNRTFVTVTRYSYVSAAELLALTAAVAAYVPGPGMFVAAGAVAAGTAVQGYFVTTSTYLFQLDVTNDKINELISKYSADISGLYTDDDIKLKFVGMADAKAAAAMKISLSDDVVTKLITRATIQATDGVIAKLQSKHDQFKTLATLHQDGKNLFAYVGTKEGCEEGTKFEVLQKTIDDNGNEVFEVVGKVKIKRGQLWDNRAGANEQIEGGETDKKGNANLSYSGFGKSKKLLEGSLIRQME